MSDPNNHGERTQLIDRKMIIVALQERVADLETENMLLKERIEYLLKREFWRLKR